MKADTILLEKMICTTMVSQNSALCCYGARPVCTKRESREREDRGSVNGVKKAPECYRYKKRRDIPPCEVILLLDVRFDKPQEFIKIARGCCKDVSGIFVAHFGDRFTRVISHNGVAIGQRFKVILHAVDI